MKSLLLATYDRLTTRRRWLWAGLAVCIALMLGGALALHYNEDIMDFLPVTEEDREALERYREQEVASRIVLIIEGEDENRRNDALEALVERFDERMPDVQVNDRMVDDQMVNDFYALMPYYIADSTYARLDSLLQPEAIRDALRRDKALLATPGTSFLIPAVRHDPLGLVSLQSLTTNDQVLTTKTYAFVESPYGGTESIRNGPFVDSLNAQLAVIRSQFPDLDMRWIGAPVISVANARRIKLDSVLCISLSLVLITALLLYAFPRRKDILLILASVLFGWLFGMAVLRLFTPSVSAVVLGIGSVLIGIAVNYPLHLLVHRRYTTSVRQTLDEVLSPLVVGNITTVGAFLALVPLQASALRHLGIFAAAMLVGTILFCIFVLPHLMSAAPTPVREIKLPEGEKTNDKTARAFQWATIGLTVLFGIYLICAQIVNGKWSNGKWFDSDLHHINYITEQQDADMTSFELRSGDAPQWTAFWQNHDPEQVIARVQALAAEEGFRPEAFEPFYNTLRTWQPVRAFDTGLIAERLSGDFDYIGLCCSAIVFLFLLLSFRSVWLALIAFAPMALSWVWILAIMHMSGLQFNIVNIILATFIFGQGDDYTIFMVEGLLYEHRTGKPMLPQYRQSVLLSALIMLLGIGILVLAVHPAMHSLGVITLIGMSVVLLMALTVPPMLFRLYARCKRYTSIFFCLATLLLLPACGRHTNTDGALLRELDRCVKERTVYHLPREHQADSLHALLTDSVSDYERFEIYGRLIETYRSYNLDSQQYYADQRLRIARTPFERQVSLLNYAEVLMRSGMYHETILYMDSALQEPLNPVLEPYYSHLRRTLFGLMRDFAITEREREHYTAVTQQYREAMMEVHPAGSFLHELVLADYLYEKQLYDSALHVLEAYERTNGERLNGEEETVFAVTRAQIYNALGNREKEKHYLIISSLADLHQSIREYISLRELAILLYNEGDIDRAYTYMQCAAQDAMAGSARVRSIETSILYPVVEEAYLNQVRKRHYGLVGLAASVLVIAVLLLGFLAYVSRKRRQLAVLNNRLEQSNRDLRQSNRIKTVYLGRYMKMTTYQDFDDAFLELFPDFVAQVQSLLVPEAELRIKPGERMNTDLRVLALIHLGITDSKQIAEFLRYSLSTIYNSRTRMRNLAKDGREHFEEKVVAL